MKCLSINIFEQFTYTVLNAYSINLIFKNEKNMDADMKKYFDVAESVYENINLKNQSSKNIIDCLNRLLVEIKKEAAINDLKLKYSAIDFESCLNRPMKERIIKIDLSLLPSFNNRYEYILWLASFIKSISVSRTESF